MTRFWDMSQNEPDIVLSVPDVPGRTLLTLLTCYRLLQIVTDCYRLLQRNSAQLGTEFLAREAIHFNDAVLGTQRLAGGAGSAADQDRSSTVVLQKQFFFTFLYNVAPPETS